MQENAPIAEGLRLVEEADRHLGESRFTEAAQVYRRASALLGQADPAIGRNVEGLHYLARAIDSYFEDHTDSALQAIAKARSRFHGSEQRDHLLFCAALEETLRALHAHETDDYEAAHRHLSQAHSQLADLAYSSQEHAGPCAFWRDWASFQVYGGQLCELADDMEPEDAEELLAKIGDPLTALADRASDVNAKQIFASLGALYDAVAQLAVAIHAFSHRANGLALERLRTVVPALHSASAKLRTQHLPAHVREINESFLYLESMAHLFTALAQAESHIYSGDRVAAVMTVQETLSVLLKQRDRFTPMIRGGLGFDIELEDLIGRARKHLGWLTAGDPGIMRLQDEVAKIVPTAHFKGTVAQMRELTNAYTSRLWVSSLALAGGLIEALLLAAIISNATPPSGCIPPAELTRLTSLALAKLIGEAEQLQLLTKGAIHLSDGVREFRNLLHPGKRIRDGHDPAEAEAGAALAVLRVVIKDLAQSAEKRGAHSP